MFKRIEFFKKHMSGVTLDIGCNSGILHKELSKFDDNIYGLDRKLENYKNRVVKGDAVSLPFRKKTFDTIVAGELIEHLEDPKKFIEECDSALKPKGRLILSTPNRDSWWNRILKTYHNIHHKSVMNEKEIRDLLKKTNFKTEKIAYMPFDKDGLQPGVIHFIFIRKLISYFIPRKLKEDMVILAIKK